MAVPLQRGAALALSAILAAGCLLLGGEERKIARRLDELAEAASVSGEESAMVRMAAAARVGRYFTEDATLDGGDGGAVMRGRDAVVALAAQARTAIGELQVRFTDLDIAVPTPESATVHVTLVVSGRVQSRGPGQAGTPPAPRPTGSPESESLDARELLITLRRVEGEWLVASVDPLTTLERPR